MVWNVAIYIGKLFDNTLERLVYPFGNQFSETRTGQHFSLAEAAASILISSGVTYVNNFDSGLLLISLYIPQPGP